MRTSWLHCSKPPMRPRSAAEPGSAPRISGGFVLLIPGRRLPQRLFRLFSDTRLGLLLLDQQTSALFLRLFALGDIDVRARHAVSRSGGVLQGHPPREDPAVTAVLVSEAILT